MSFVEQFECAQGRHRWMRGLEFRDAPGNRLRRWWQSKRREECTRCLACGKVIVLATTKQMNPEKPGLWERRRGALDEFNLP